VAASTALAEVLHSERWREQRFQQRGKVT
jgi:hypothetical protein